MYPLNLQLASPAIGFAVANDEAEHAALTDSGYLPALEKKTEQPVENQAIAAVRAQLDAAGIAYDGRMGIAKLTALLPA